MEKLAWLSSGKKVVQKNAKFLFVKIIFSLIRTLSET